MTWHFDEDLGGTFGMVRTAQKAAAGWPGWEHDQALAAHYAPLIRQALAEGVDPEQMAADWLRQVVKDNSGALGWLTGRGIAGRVFGKLKDVLSKLWTEGWFLGRRSATAVLHGGPADWGTWTPGDVAAAALVEGDRGLQDLLDSYGIATIHSIAGTRMGELADALQEALESGDSAEKLARGIRGILDDPSRAQMIADTEVARSVSSAAIDQFKGDGVTAVEWNTAPEDVCPECQANADEGAVPVGFQFIHKPGTADAPPCHPGCRCVLIPAAMGAVSLATKGASDPGDPNPVDAEHVYNLMRANFPPKALGWVRKARWIGPVEVAQDRLDDDDLSSWAASHQPDRVKHFAKRIKKGDLPRPAVVVQEPGDANVKVIDGHHRTLAYRKLGEPVPAYVGFVDSDGGPWDQTHSYQTHQGDDPANKALEKVGPKGYIHGWVFVGAPGVGQSVNHPHLGAGVVTGHTADHVHVRFDRDGSERVFEHDQRHPDQPGALHPRALAQMSDEDLADEVGRPLDVGDDEHLAAIEREMQMRDEPWLSGRDTNYDPETGWRNLPAETEQDRKVSDLAASGHSYLDAYAEVHQADAGRLASQRNSALVDRVGGETTDQALRREYDEWVHLNMLAAEKATRGNLLSRSGRAAGYDPAKLFSGPIQVARRNASEELQRWWAEHGRVTFTEWRAMVLGRESDRRTVAAGAARSNGKDFI